MQHTDATLDLLRLEGDLLADSIMAELLESQKVGEVNRVLRNFCTNTEPIPQELPPNLQEYLQVTTNPPSWVDNERIKRAHAFFLDDGLNISTVLTLGALVNCYAVPHGAKLLTATCSPNQSKRRVAETGQFYMHLTEENAFGEGSKLIPTIQKVRLIHAAVRYLLASNDKWSVEQYGVPICQEDMLGALLLFSLEVIEGLKRLELPITEQEAEDYYYVWRVAGVMLGIREDIIPETVAECYALNELLKQRHIGYSPEGVQLTHNLIKIYQDNLPTKLLNGLVPAMVRYVVQDEIADLMQIPHTKWHSVAKAINQVGKVAVTAKDNNGLVRQVLSKAAAMMLESQIRMLNNGEQANYDIPCALAKSQNQYH